jgi:uncharacterized cupredoxin-like copper-binding protein
MRSKRLLAVTAGLAALAAAGALVALGAGGKVSVSMKEWKMQPVPSSSKAGSITFSVHNRGHLAHQFIVVKTNLPANKLPLKGATVNLAKLKVLGKVSSIQPGKTKTLGLKLAAGKYVLLCNLPAHYKAGQYTSFTVK